MASGPVSWCSRNETVVVTSSCEGEHMAIYMECKDAVWIHILIADSVGHKT